LKVAAEVISKQGTGASLRDIARRAGVGLGTFYRHFPTREALLGSLLKKTFEGLAQRARTLEESSSPYAALALWLQDFAEGVGTYRGLSASIMATLQDRNTEFHAACLRMQEAGGRLLERAQISGGIREDIQAIDLFALANAVAWIADQSASIAQRKEHLFSILMQGLTHGAEGSHPVGSRTMHDGTRRKR
jgi:AcrR family transcriptional regulator